MPGNTSGHVILHHHSSSFCTNGLAISSAPSTGLISITAEPIPSGRSIWERLEGGREGEAGRASADDEAQLAGLLSDLVGVVVV